VTKHQQYYPFINPCLISLGNPSFPEKKLFESNSFLETIPQEEVNNSIVLIKKIQPHQDIVVNDFIGASNGKNQMISTSLRICCTGDHINEEEKIIVKKVDQAIFIGNYKQPVSYKGE
jgi:hypothetical protein